MISFMIAYAPKAPGHDWQDDDRYVEHGLLVDASLYGIWPQGPATAWSTADWDEIRRRDERVERWASEL